MSTFCEPDRKKSRRYTVRRKTAKNLAWNPRFAHAATLEEADPSGLWRWVRISERSDQ